MEPEAQGCVLIFAIVVVIVVVAATAVCGVRVCMFPL